MLVAMFAVAILSALPPDPLALPPASTPPLRARLTDPAVIRVAVREAVAADPAPPPGSGTMALSARQYRGFAQAMEEARVPDCLHPDAMKHQPPKIGPIDLGGIFVLPFWAAAIVRGKCN